jgi:16S rRNA (adenine1518-N6/adenine1519-N6)-dimethyltransferase
MIVEIGAGLGLLTEALADGAGRVVALEIDPRLLAVLRDRFSSHPVIEVWGGDVLDYDFSALAGQERIKVVGNIPYHISTPILFHLLSHRRVINSMLLMFQKELGERIAASPGASMHPFVPCSRYFEVTPALTVPPALKILSPRVYLRCLHFRVRRDWYACR